MNLEGNNIVINVYDLIGQLRVEHLHQIIDALACHAEIVDEVMNQVIDGTTTDGSYAATSFGGNPKAFFGLDGARMRIAKASGDIAAKEIERLDAALDRAKAYSNDGWAKYYKLLDERRI